MNLLQLKSEVLANGFDPTAFGTRVVNYLNDGYFTVVRRTDYYVDETSEAVATVAGTATISLPAQFGRGRELVDTDRQTPLQEVMLEDIDSSTVVQGTPYAYAIDGQNLHLYPTPDGVHNLLFRYWQLPSVLVNDGDTPILPADYHFMLVEFATARCYHAEDDPQMKQDWMNDFNVSLSNFQADQKFPTDTSFQARSMWDQGPGLGRGWGFPAGI